MEIKKNPTKEIHQHRTLFLLIGLIVSITLVLFAFEFKTDYTSPEAMFIEESGFFIPDIPQTKHEEPKPPQPKQFNLIEVQDPIEVTDIELPDVSYEPDDSFEEPQFIDTEEEESPEEEFVFAEKQASFPGGQEAWMKYLRKNLKYPRQAQRMGIEGKVYLNFLVDAEGNISNIEVPRGIGGGCDQEAIRVLENAPNWNPGLQRGQPVKSPMSIYIVFRLK